MYDCYINIIKSIINNDKNYKYKIIIPNLLNTIFIDYY